MEEIIYRSEYGGSIPVDNVQALASKDLKNVPIRYIRPEIESEEVLTDESLQIPVIDISKLTVAGQPGYDDELAKLHVACKDWGFFQIMSNGEYSSIEHRVVVDFENERLSLAAFHNPGIETMIGPMMELCKEKTPKYKTINSENYMSLIVNTKLDGKCLIDHMKIQ